jgi:hypothetical protein
MFELQNPWFIPVYIFFAILLGAMAWNMVKFIYFIITFKGKKPTKKFVKK